MALTTSRSISLSGQSIINGITVETYNASVSETNPESMYINQSTVNHEMRKANRAQCRKDRDEFEELAYSIQDEIRWKNTNGSWITIISVYIKSRNQTS